MKRLLLFAIALVFTIGCSSNPEVKEEVKVESFSDAEPDKHGILRQEELPIGDFEDVVLFASGWWPGGGNRLYPRYGLAGDMANGYTGGTMLVVKYSPSNYTCYLAGVNNDLFSWISTESGKEFTINIGNLGNAKYTGENKIIYTKASDSTIYGAINSAWRLHKESEFNTTTFKFRDQKEYPEYFKYLGWCSWEGFKRDITAQKLIDVVGQINESDIPVRYMLIDDGHQQQHEGDPWDYNGITRFGPMESIFPNGYEELLQYKDENKIKWMGLWLAGLGGRDGIYPENSVPKEVQDVLAMTHMNTLMPDGSRESAQVFYDHYIDEHITNPGWDFTKIDFQSRALTHYAGGEMANIPVKDNSGAFANPQLAATNLALALEEILQKRGKGVIHCNAQAAFSLFNLNTASVERCSEDYALYDKGRARNHLHNSYSTIPFLGQVVWGDHDMFHSSDSVSGRMMAVSKAISGGPVYLSDLPHQFVGSVISPLCYKDGELLRPLAPAAPTESSFFTNAQVQPKAYLAFAPLKNRSVAVVAYNLYAKLKMNDKFYSALEQKGYPESLINSFKAVGDVPLRNNDEFEVFQKEQLKLTDPKDSRYMRAAKGVLFDCSEPIDMHSEITPEIYQSAPAMMQNGEQKWEIPAEGLLCYDWIDQKAKVLGNKYDFHIDGFGDKLYLLTPIEHGWSVIGDASKYLSPASYEIASIDDNTLMVTMHEGGSTLVVWSKGSSPIKSSAGSTQQLSEGLWQIELPDDVSSVTLSR